LERTNASTQTVNRAAEIRTLAERQMGEFLQQMPMNPGVRGSHLPNDQRGSDAEPRSEPTLAEIGITKKQSFQAQRLAAIPKEEFTERIETIKATGERLTPNKVLNAGRTENRTAR
jgi:hypothetical protein